MSFINDAESEILEFKESLAELEDAGKSVCGFMNKSGGVLYIGVKNSGEVIGLGTINETTTRRVSQTIFDNLEPRMPFSVGIEEIEGDKAIKLVVSHSLTPYHSYKKIPYIRIGSTTKEMDQSDYQQRLISFNSTNRDYSSSLMNHVSMNDLSSEAIAEFRKLLISSERYQLDISSLTDEQLLKDTLLLRDGKLTIAAVVLLGTERTLSQYLPYSEIRFCYKSVEGDISSQDTQIYRGGYLTYYQKVWDKIQARNLSLTIPFGMRIIDRKAFDEQTIREGINNAIVHRDYLVQESCFIFQYPTKIIIKSAGSFPSGVTVDNILTESRPRNKLIADILFKCGLVEQFGNGVNLMYKNQLSLGKNPPDFSKSNERNVVLELDGTIQDIEFAKYVLRVAEKAGKFLNDEELVILNKIRKGKIVDVPDVLRELLELGLIEKINYRQYMLSKTYYVAIDQKGTYTKKQGLTKNKNKELIIKHLEHFGSGKKSDFAQIFQFELSEKQIENLLQELRKEDRIVFDGKPRSSKGVWKLSQNPRFSIAS